MSEKQEVYFTALFATVLANITDGWMQAAWSVVTLGLWAAYCVGSWLDRRDAA